MATCSLIAMCSNLFLKIRKYAKEYYNPEKEVQIECWMDKHEIPSLRSGDYYYYYYFYYDDGLTWSLTISNPVQLHFPRHLPI